MGKLYVLFIMILPGDTQFRAEASVSLLTLTCEIFPVLLSVCCSLAFKACVPCDSEVIYQLAAGLLPPVCCTVMHQVRHLQDKLCPL